MSILTLNMSKFLKCLILINSVIFLNSISIDSYVQKNYGFHIKFFLILNSKHFFLLNKILKGVELNISAL